MTYVDMYIEGSKGVAANDGREDSIDWMIIIEDSRSRRVKAYGDNRSIS